MADKMIPERELRGFNRVLHLCRRDRDLLIIISLPFVYYILFKYLPMYGVILAFKDFAVNKGILGSPWVGLRWFEQFFSSPYFFRLIRNTFLLSIYSIIFSFPVPIVFAILLSEIRYRWYQRVAQTASYLPYFLSMVVAMGMVVNFLNVALVRLGLTPLDFMNDARWFRTIYVVSGIWQTFGFNAILYLAAITAIDPQLYEAATIDGATQLQKIRSITLPSIVPTIVILLILNLGNMLNVGFEKIILLYTPANYETADVISTYVYRRGLQENNFGFGTAVGLFNSVINLVLIIVFNKLSRRLSSISLW
ncbi:MAG: sugar ABC transporter permease [Spirochaetes bacterium RBG_13_68_11]|nr:MAG: sugar ABC transporter permease [Spirochaetes bacterium RBG_13_68_11]